MSSLSAASSNAAAEAFASATLEIVDRTRRRHPKPPEGLTAAHRTRAYYRDSSGRARIHLRLRLAAAAAGGDGDGGLGALLECGCIQPVPVDSIDNGMQSSGENMGESKNQETEEINNDNGDDGEDEENLWRNELSTIGKVKGAKSPWYTATTCAFEATVARSSSTSWALEGVTIHRSEIEREVQSDAKMSAPVNALLFDVEIAVAGNGVSQDGEREALEEGELELRAVLQQREKYRGGKSTATKSLLGGREGAGVAAGLLGLELGGGSFLPDLPGPSPLSGNEVETHYDVRILRTSPPLRVRAALVPPLQLTVREVPGARAASGSTLMEVKVEHPSGCHGEDVAVTGIAFHPGQSRLWEGGDGGGDAEDKDADGDCLSPAGKSMQGGELSVIDMSRRVRWGFAPGSAPNLPLVLRPHEAFATVIQVDAGEDVRSRSFLSPVSVNATIGRSSDRAVADSGDEGLSEGLSEDWRGGERIAVAADARWTSSRVGVENSDAFRVDMSLRGSSCDAAACLVGAPLVVSLRVLNLSMEPRDLMLLMAKDGEGRNRGGLQWERPPVGGRRRRAGGRAGGPGNRSGGLLHQRPDDSAHDKENHGFNTAVVSEVNGYTFGVWGLSGDDDGTTRHHRDHELLAVDAALLLGEVKGQHSIEAELRFVPLREGTLDVPNLKLYDKRGMKWYNCVHTLKIVARQSIV